MMFIFDWLPTILFQIMLVVGAVGFFITVFFDHIIPLSWDLLVKMIVGVCLTLGLLSIGVNSERDKHAKELAEAQAKISQLETAAANLTTKTVIQYVDRIKIVKEKGATIEKQIPIYVPKESDAKCTVDSGFVRGYNSSASEVPGTASSPNGASSGAK